MRAILIPLLVLLIATPGSVTAQDAATLDRADELARAGRTEEARVELLRWWEGAYQDASRTDVQRSLWLRGRLTVDPLQAELDFRRLVVEYPGGPYSGQALLRLAQSTLSKGDSASAAIHARRLLVEYPAAAGGRDATEWLAHVGPLLEEEALPPPPVRAAEVDARPQAPRNSTPPPRDPVASAVPGGHAVQLGAFSSEERARALRDKATEAGLEARLVRVRGSELLRVRVGAFVSAGEATAASLRIQEMGFATAMVDNVGLEEAVAR